MLTLERPNAQTEVVSPSVTPLTILEYRGEPLLDRRHIKRVITDAEWQGKPFCTSQYGFRNPQTQLVDDVLVIWFGKGEDPERHSYPGVNVTIVKAPEGTILTDVVNLPKTVKLELFYSPRDVEAAVGRDTWRCALQTKTDRGPQIKKTRNITGSLRSKNVTLELTDWMGAANGTLDNFIKSQGIKGMKDLVKATGNSKDRMGVMQEKNPNEFLDYAIGDVVYLGEASLKRVEQINQITKEALDIDMGFTLDTFPRSSGSLVAKCWEAWLIAKYPKVYQAVLLQTRCLDNKQYYWWKNQRLSIKLGGADIQEFNRVLRNRPGFVHGMAQGSIKGYGTNYPLNTGNHGAIVMGGRCVNEDPRANPYDQFERWMIDIDLSGCYGSALRSFKFPLGIPTVLAFDQDDDDLTLGAFLAKTEDELVDGLWDVKIRGFLGFEQDLVHSKYGLSTTKIAKTILGENWQHQDEDVSNRETASAHLGGDFHLTLREIENGIITSEVLKAVRKIASPDELRQWMNLTVVQASYYPKSLMMEPDDWAEYMMDDKHRGGVTGAGQDYRSRRWCFIPLEGFVGSFINLRKGWQWKQRDKTLPQENRDLAKLTQNAIKLFINTTYGCLASPFFPMGNTVVANNITAKARVGVWMMSKALLLKQTITDGGMFGWQRVATLTPGAKKPSMHTLANRARFLAHRSVKSVSLGDGRNWHHFIKEGFEIGVDENDVDVSGVRNRELDQVCLQHVNDFWANYGLSLPFDIECKHENTCEYAVWWNSDYLLVNPVKDGKDLGLGMVGTLKSRGTKDEDHPKRLWLQHLADPETFTPPKPLFHFQALIGISEYQAQPTKYDAIDLLPGEDQEKTTVLRLIARFLMENHKTLTARDSAWEKKKRRDIKSESDFTQEEWETYKPGLLEHLETLRKTARPR